MHAFLIIGNNTKYLEQSTEELAKKLHTKIVNFPLAKIEDVRNLNNLLRLSFNEPTLIVSKNIEEATDEALNAFLKNLEEPQENIYFALTASSVRKVIPTIVSRCQIIKTTNDYVKTDKQIAKPENKDEIIAFINMTPSQKLTFFDKIKGRNEAINFVESLIFFLSAKRDFTNMELLIKTRTRLRANGNVNLHLLNLVTQYGK